MSIDLKPVRALSLVEENAIIEHRTAFYKAVEPHLAELLLAVGDHLEDEGHTYSDAKRAVNSLQGVIRDKLREITETTRKWTDSWKTEREEFTPFAQKALANYLKAVKESHDGVRTIPIRRV